MSKACSRTRRPWGPTLGTLSYKNLGIVAILAGIVVIIPALAGVLGQGGAVQALMVAAIILPVAVYLLYSGGSAIPPASLDFHAPPWH